MKNKTYHAVETVPQSNWRIVEIGKIDTPNTYMHDRPLSWLGTGTSIKSGEVELVLCAKPHLLMKWAGLASVFHMQVVLSKLYKYNLNLLTSTDDFRKNPGRKHLFTLAGKTVFRPPRVHTMADAVYFTSVTYRGSTSSSYIIANIILYIGNTWTN